MDIDGNDPFFRSGDQNLKHNDFLDNYIQLDYETGDTQ